MRCLLATKSLALILLLSPLGCGDDHGHVASPECDEIGEACHESTTMLGMSCHDNAHDVWTAAQCTAERAACLAECATMGPDAAPGTPDAGLPMSDAMWATEQMTFNMPAGAIAEAELMMTAGSTVRSEFTAGGSLTWNLHTHVNGMTQILAEGTAAMHVETYTATATAPIWLHWRNPVGSPATSLTVTITLSEGASFVRWE